MKCCVLCFQFLDSNATDTSMLELSSTPKTSLNTTTKLPSNTDKPKTTPEANGSEAGKSTTTTTKVQSTTICNN